MAVPSAQTLTVVPGADPNPTILATGSGLAVSLSHRFTHLRATTVLPLSMLRCFSELAKWGGCIPKGQHPQEHPRVLQRCEVQESPGTALIPPQEGPGWEMKASSAVNVSLLGKLLAGAGWGRASAFCWSLGLHRGDWQIHRRTK